MPNPTLNAIVFRCLSLSIPRILRREYLMQAPLHLRFHSSPANNIFEIQLSFGIEFSVNLISPEEVRRFAR
jgi:hypothetical protein